MAKKGLLVDMAYCTGCHACEVACKQENRLQAGYWGIRISEMITEYPDSDRVHFDYIPYFSPLCNLCAPRIAAGESSPACVKHCGTASIYYGDIEALAKRMAELPRSILYTTK